MKWSWCVLFTWLTAAMGCVSHLLEQRSMTWQQVVDFAKVEFGEAIMEGHVLIVPVEVEAKPNNSLHVLLFDAEAVGDRIFVRGKLCLPENAPVEKRDIISVALPIQTSTTYLLSYKDPNGVITDIKQIDIVYKE